MALSLRSHSSVALVVGVLLSGCASDLIQSVQPAISVTCADSTESTAAECAEIDFGSVLVGQTATRLVTVSDPGRGRLTIVQTGWTGDAAAFHSDAQLSSVEPSAKATFHLSFTPTTVGANEAVFFIASNSLKTPRVELHVKGLGVTPATATLDPTMLDFGNVAMGQPTTKTVTLTNTDTAAIEIVSAGVDSGSPEFALAMPQSTTVPPGMSVPLQATYAPVDVGADTAQASVQVRRTDTPTAAPTALSLQLAGESVPVIQVAPMTLDFGAKTLGSTTDQNLSISNVGKAPLDLKTIALSAGTSSTFTLGEPLPTGATLQPGSGVLVVVHYQPVPQATMTDDTGAVAIESSDPVNPSVAVSLNGQCTDCVVPPPTSCAMNRTCHCGPQSTCEGGSCIPARRVFVSQTTTNGNLQGVAGGDMLCNQYATTAQLGGTWKAFIADSSSSPASRFSLASVPYVLVDGTRIADNGQGLLSTSLQHGIDLDECQRPISNAEVWTGLDSPSATAGSAVCDNFTSSSNTASYAPVGLSGRSDSGWYNVYLQFCDRGNVRLYCVEQ